MLTWSLPATPPPLAATPLQDANLSTLTSASSPALSDAAQTLEETPAASPAPSVSPSPKEEATEGSAALSWSDHSIATPWEQLEKDLTRKLLSWNATTSRDAFLRGKAAEIPLAREPHIEPASKRSVELRCVTGAKASDTLCELVDEDWGENFKRWFGLSGVDHLVLSATAADAEDASSSARFMGRRRKTQDVSSAYLASALSSALCAASQARKSPRDPSSAPLPRPTPGFVAVRGASPGLDGFVGMAFDLETQSLIYYETESVARSSTSPVFLNDAIQLVTGNPVEEDDASREPPTQAAARWTWIVAVGSTQASSILRAASNSIVNRSSSHRLGVDSVRVSAVWPPFYQDEHAEMDAYCTLQAATAPVWTTRCSWTCATPGYAFAKFEGETNTSILGKGAYNDHGPEFVSNISKAVIALFEEDPVQAQPPLPSGALEETASGAAKLEVSEGPTSSSPEASSPVVDKSKAASESHDENSASESNLAASMMDTVVSDFKGVMRMASTLVAEEWNKSLDVPRVALMELASRVVSDVREDESVPHDLVLAHIFYNALMYYNAHFPIRLFVEMVWRHYCAALRTEFERLERAREDARGAIDWSRSVLQQKTSIVQLCGEMISRSKDRKEEEQEKTLDARGDELGRLAALEFTLLARPEQRAYEPVTQSESAALFWSNRDDAVDSLSSDAREELIKPVLVSDMRAFKAANPGCEFIDFVRWFSPKDVVLPAAEGPPALSVRMSATSSKWTIAWNESTPTRAVDQKQLFDPNTESERALHYLETAVSNLGWRSFVLKGVLPEVAACLEHKGAEIARSSGAESTISLTKCAQQLEVFLSSEDPDLELLGQSMSALDLCVARMEALRNNPHLPKGLADALIQSDGAAALSAGSAKRGCVQLVQSLEGHDVGLTRPDMKEYLVTQQSRSEPIREDGKTLENPAREPFRRRVHVAVASNDVRVSRAERVRLG